MRTIQLDKNDSQQIVEFIRKYKSLHTNIEMTIKKLNTLNEDKNELIKELTELRKDELKFTEIFKDKYGEGKLDLETGTYKIK